MQLPPISRPSLYNWSRMGARPMWFVAHKKPKAATWDLEQEEQEGEASRTRREYRRQKDEVRDLSGRQEGLFLTTLGLPTKDPTFPSFLPLDAMILFKLTL